VPRRDLPLDPVILPFLRETAWDLYDLDGGLLKAPPTARGQRKKTMRGRRSRRSLRYDRRSAFQLGRVVMAALLIILLVLILVRLLQ
jgi:hypothetical protein